MKCTSLLEARQSKNIEDLVLIVLFVEYTIGSLEDLSLIKIFYSVKLLNVIFGC
jgi:hypothetical protein